MTGFYLDQMPLGSSIGGKRKRLLRVLSKLLMLFDRKSMFYFKNCTKVKDLLQTDATDATKPNGQF